MDWLQLIGSLGFPIVACIGIAWYLKDRDDKHREDLKEIQRQNSEQISEMQRQNLEQIAALQAQHAEETKALREEMGEMNKTLTELVVIMRTKEVSNDNVGYSNQKGA